MKRINTSTIAGMLFASSGLIVLELTLTRIFSVTMWYHFAFMVISIAMLGLSAAAALVHRYGRDVNDERLVALIPPLCIVFSISALAGNAVVLRLHFSQTLGVAGIVQLGLIYILTTIPFIAGGSVIAIAVRVYGASMSSLYSADLIGAGLGCLLVIPILRLFGGPETIYVATILFSAAGVFFALPGKKRIYGIPIIVLALLFGVNETTGLLRVIWAKQRTERGLLHEAWNSYSRITVFSTEEEWNTQFFGWGMSPVYDGPLPRQLGMHIDSYAGTPISEYRGIPGELKHLRYDITALGYHLRPHGMHLVVGPGGGRDILAALELGADSVVAVEVNHEVYRAVNEVFGSFSGKPYSLPGVEGVVAEARSFLRRDSRSFDIIQASLVDTWAATAAGAYTLSENTLYTVEAMTDYFHRLNDDGLVSISRFIFEPPRESLRLFAVALTALHNSGAKRPSDHIAVLSCKGVATVIVGKKPLGQHDIRHLTAISDSLKFDVVYLPLEGGHDRFVELSTRFKDDEFYRSYPFDVSPTTDDRPFFFNMVKPVDFLKVFRLNDLQGQTHSYDAVFILVAVLGISFVMTVILIFLPLQSQSSSIHGRGIVFALYYVFIGLGFMLAEVTLLQKLVLFLGHPVYSLTIVLFGVLVFGGIGSFLSRLIAVGRERLWIIAACVGLAVIFITALWGLDIPLTRFLGAPRGIRFLLALILLSPAGLIMGMPLPLGIRVASAWRSRITPWLWGVNGAASVLGSILAFAIAMNAGFKITFILAAVCYLFAALMFSFIKYSESSE